MSNLSQSLMQSSNTVVNNNNNNLTAPVNVVIPPRPTPQVLSNDLISSLNMLKYSMNTLPQSTTNNSTDLNKTNTEKYKYVPKTPYTCHPSFPTTQPPNTIIENPLLLERLCNDTLFLAFYFQQGSYQQYLAAKQLKKLSWRYHCKYMTWFHRHEEPTKTTDEYEEGTYVYFDHENGWCQRIKPDFKFEYSFLEDDL